MDELEMLKEIDKMIDETQDLDRELEETRMSRETLTAQTEELKAEYNALSSKLELTFAAPLPLRWEKLLRLNNTDNPDAVRLLNMYISDCNFFGGEADECLTQYAATKKRLEELTAWEDWYSTQSQQYARLVNRVKSCKAGRAESGTDAEAVFNLIMRNGCTSRNADPSILLDNLTEISSFIHGAGLANVSPLIWFLVIIHNQKKLCSTPGFIVNPQNILRYQEYNISQNNGKNFDQYEQYCNLYLDLKDMFPQADMDLCDMGFLKCSNLAQWCCDFVEYPCGIPSTAAGIIERFSPDFFSDPWNEIELLSSSNITYDDLERWEFAHSRLTVLIQSAVQSIRPDDIHELLRNSREFIHKLAENSGILSEIRSEDVYMTLISLCVKAVARFEVLFAEQTACAIVL